MFGCAIEARIKQDDSSRMIKVTTTAQALDEAEACVEGIVAEYGLWETSRRLISSGFGTLVGYPLSEARRVQGRLV